MSSARRRLGTGAPEPNELSGATNSDPEARSPHNLRDLKNGAPDPNRAATALDSTPSGRTRNQAADGPLPARVDPYLSELEGEVVCAACGGYVTKRPRLFAKEAPIRIFLKFRLLDGPYANKRVWMAVNFADPSGTCQQVLPGMVHRQ